MDEKTYHPSQENWLKNDPIIDLKICENEHGRYYLAQLNQYVENHALFVHDGFVFETAPLVTIEHIDGCVYHRVRRMMSVKDFEDVWGHVPKMYTVKYSANSWSNAPMGTRFGEGEMK